MKVSVRDFKAHLSRYLKDACSGRDVVITSRGRPIARLLSLADELDEEPDPEEVLRRVKLIPGIGLASGGKPLGAKKPIRIRPGEKTLAEIVLEGRR
jgi:prevent-host-death family protein